MNLKKEEVDTGPGVQLHYCTCGLGWQGRRFLLASSSPSLLVAAHPATSSAHLSTAATASGFTLTPFTDIVPQSHREHVLHLQSCHVRLLQRHVSLLDV